MRRRKLAAPRWDRCRLELMESSKDKARSSGPRSESEIQEAGRRAALLIPDDVGTMLFEYDDLASKKNDYDSFPVPPPRLPPISTSAENVSNGGAIEKASEEVPSSNPLTSLLGYSMDDSPTHARQNEAPDNMDKELASFMEELESSGLLGEEEAKKDQTPEKVPEKMTAAQPSIGGGHISTSPTDSSQPSEQKVMGEVVGAPDWHRVLDSGSGTTYFWNSSSDEVSWDPPPGVELPENGTDKPISKPDASENEENMPKTSPEKSEQESRSVPAGETEGKQADTTETAANSDEAEKEMNDVDLNGEENGEIHSEPSSIEDVSSVSEGPESETAEVQMEMKEGVEKEEGELTEEVAPSSQKVAESQALWKKVSETVKGAKNGVGEWYGAIPEAVRLAIVAETHMDHWMFMTGQLHQSAEGHGGCLDKFWTAYERYVEEAMDHISESIPAAVAQLGYAAGQATEADPSISSQNQVVQPAEYQWDSNTTNYIQDWSAYTGVGTGTVHLPPLPTEPVPPLPPDSGEEPPPPPPGTDDIPEVQDDDADVSMDLSDGEGPDMGVDSVHSSAGVASSASYEAPAADIQHGYVASAELQGESTPHANGEVQAAGRDSPDLAEGPQTEPETHKGTNDKKRRIDKVAGSGMGLLGKKKKISKASKTLSKLMNQWQAVKQKEEEQVSEEDPFNMEAVERKRVAEMEEWRLNQLRSGEAENNANFQPLKGDWRARVKRALPVKASGSSPRKTEKSSVQKAVDLEELSKGLPEGWKALVDDVSGEVYYGNVNTREAVWERP
ncbi:hypothetical protein BSKO_04184 [Bryopsis sp. KO-2023]|nr:hypothetical protein BSKO_04184 [Bryopsis sp. KO-2023]